MSSIPPHQTPTDSANDRDLTRAARDALFKACFLHALEVGAQWIVATARQPLDRVYEGLLFEDVFERGRMIEPPYAPGVPHRVLALCVPQAAAKWVARAHPLLDFMLHTQPGHIDTGGAREAPAAGTSIALQRHRVLPGVGSMAEPLHEAAVVQVP